MFGVWTQAAAKWGWLVWSHQLGNIDWFVFLDFQFGILTQQVPHWHQELSHELFLLSNAYFIAFKFNEMLRPRSLARNHKWAMPQRHKSGRMCRQLAGLKAKKRLPICLQGLKGYFSNLSSVGLEFFNNKLRDGSNSTWCFVYELHLPFFDGGLVVGWLVFSHCFSHLSGQRRPNLCGGHGKQLW